MSTLKEKVAVYESVLHAIQLHKEVTLNYQRLSEILDEVSNWSYAHRAGNGEDTTKAVKEAFDRLKGL